MKQTIRKLFTKVGSSFNSNVVHLVNKKCLAQPLRNITNSQKSTNKNFKDRYVSEYNKSYESSQKISFAGYCLLGLPIGAFMLGTWQIQRHRWKLDLIEKLAIRTTAEPIELLANLEDLESKEYYPVKVKGTFLYDKEFSVGHRSLIKEGKPAADSKAMINDETQRGYHVITPFKLKDQDMTILVNRGWVPRSLKNSRQRQESQIVGETEIVGILRLNERRPPFVPKRDRHSDIWYYRDVNGMAEKADTAPIYIEMISNNSVQQYPIAGQTKVELRNEHLNYILTWYCLSGATAYMWYQKFIKGVALVH